MDHAVAEQAPLPGHGKVDDLTELDPQDLMRVVGRPLVNDSLRPGERLTLFRTSKALANVVLQHAERTRLLLAANGITTSSSQVATAMQLAGLARPCVELIMCKLLRVPTEALWQRVVLLGLDQVTLHHDSLRPLLQLNVPQRPIELRLTRCTFHDSNAGHAGKGSNSSHADSQTTSSTNISSQGSSNSSTASGDNSSTGSGDNCSTGSSGLAVHRLVCKDCRPQESYLASALNLIDKQQLLVLNTPGREDTTAHVLQLPQLQKLFTGAQTGDEGLQRILTHPSLQIVLWDRLTLLLDHAATQPASLRTILLGSGPSLSTLASLPLASLQQCKIVGSLFWESKDGQDARTALAAALSKVMLHQDKVRFETDKGTFTVGLGPVFSLSQVQQVIALCTRHLQGALAMYCPPATTLTALETALPQTITRLGFRWYHKLLQQGTFINRLPPHVHHVTLLNSLADASILQRALTGVTRRMKITIQLVDCGQAANGEQLASQLESQVRAWLSSYPNEVEMDVTRP